MSWILLRSLLLAIAALGVATACVWASQTIGRVLSDHVPDWGWTTGWLDSAATWLGKPAPAGVNYQAVVTAALAVTGTLAGVYFATVAFVVSTTYRDATTRVRSLVTRLPEGRVYTFVYVQAVLFALATLLLPLFGSEPNRLTLSILAVLGSLVVMSFGRLRSQLYGLLEPAGLLAVLQRDIARWMQYGLRGRRALRSWRVQTARSQVLDSITTLRELCRLIRDREQVSPDAPAEYTMVDPRVRTAVRSVATIWWGYAARKHRLIGLPGWCLTRDKHKDWLIASDFEVSIALGTATTLQAESTDDHLWLERYLSSILADLLGGRSAPQYSNLARDLDKIVRQLMAWGLFEDTRLWLDTVVLPGKQIVELQADDAHPGDADADSAQPPRPVLAHEHNLADFVGLSFAQTVLGMHDYAAAVTRGFPEWTGRQARGQVARRVGPRPTELFRNVEDGLTFERTVEGRGITSDANIHQLAALALTAELIDEATWLVDTLEDTVVPWVKRLCESPSDPAAAAVSRMDETLHKAGDVLLPALERCFAACEAVHRDVDDRWPNLDLGPLKERLSRMKQELRLPIARLASRTDAHLDPNRPDIFGWAFHRAHEDLLEDVLSIPTEDMNERLLQLVAATDRAGSRLQSTVQRTHARVANSYRAEPLLLLLQVTGIAYVHDRFNGRDQLFETFERVWTVVLENDPQQVLDAALAALAADDVLFGLSPGKLTRSNRGQRAMQSLDIVEGADIGFRWRRRSDSGRELDPEERAVVDHLSIRGDFEDVFVAAWLLPEAERRGASARQGLIAGTKLQGLIDDLGHVDMDVAGTPTSIPADTERQDKGEK